MVLFLFCRCVWFVVVVGWCTLVVVVLAVDVEEACFDFVVVDAASGVDEAESCCCCFCFRCRLMS